VRATSHAATASKDEPAYASVGELSSAIAKRGVRCGSFRRVHPLVPLERDEGRCSHFAMATFRSASRRRAWERTQFRTSWFPARFAISARNWEVWTWTHATAVNLHR